MPGANCCFNFCGVSRRRGKSQSESLSLFKLPTVLDDKSKQWRRDVLNIITKYRVKDDNFKSQLDNDTLHICEKHYKPDDITMRKCRISFMFIYFRLMLDGGWFQLGRTVRRRIELDKVSYELLRY